MVVPSMMLGAGPSLTPFNHTITLRDGHFPHHCRWAGPLPHLEMSGHFRRRGKRQEQQIALIRKLWEQAVVEHEDNDHRIDRAGILPRPKRQIPIWFGGFSQAAYDRAARIGDGFMFSGRTQSEAVKIKATIEAKLAELGRPRDSFGFESIQQYSRGDNEWSGDIAAWRDA